MKQLKLAAKRARDKARREGLRAVMDDAWPFIKRGGRLHVYQRDRVDLEERWSMIEPCIEPTDATLLDIGCAEGFLTRKFALKGIFCIGIDERSVPFEVNRAEYGYTDRLAFATMEVSPESVNCLPKVDIVLLLSVIHWWTDRYGWEAADDMVRSLAQKSNKMIFEGPGGGKLIRPDPPGEFDSLREYYRAYLEETLGTEVNIEFLGNASYKGDGQEDPLFLVNCSSVRLGGEKSSDSP